MHNIALFTYDFSHKKSTDFFENIIKYYNVIIIAAPWVNINNIKNESINEINTDIEKKCKLLKIPYFKVGHEDDEKISELVDLYNIDLGIISGARIIPKKVIALFENGIINFHPGKIPESSGLDALYHTIAKNCSYGVTVHAIDYRVDAGSLVFFDEVEIELHDSIERLKEKNYELQLQLLIRFLEFLKKDIVTYEKIERPHKNIKLNEDEKHDICLNFEIWKYKQYFVQKEEKIFQACAKGNLEYLKFFMFPSFIISLVNERGWSPLLVAAYNQRYETCKWLLESGADVNFQNQKGTSILMFAKTHAKETDLSILSLLLEYGADVNLRDCFDKNIFDYLIEEDKYEIINFIKNGGQ